MVLHPVRVIGAAQRLALVAGLPTGIAARFAAQASGSPLRIRLLQPIARRRLAAVQAEAALQLLDALDKTRDLLFQARVLLPKPGVLLLRMGVFLRGRFGRCPRRRAVWRLGIAHVIVESFPDIPVKPSRQFRANRASTHWPKMTNQTTWTVIKSAQRSTLCLIAVSVPNAREHHPDCPTISHPGRS